MTIFANLHQCTNIIIYQAKICGKRTEIYHPLPNFNYLYKLQVLWSKLQHCTHQTVFHCTNLNYQPVTCTKLYTKMKQTVPLYQTEQSMHYSKCTKLYKPVPACPELYKFVPTVPNYTNLY